MPVSPEDLFRRAQEQVQSSDELSFRDATKNAYYAAYHLLKPFESRLNDPTRYKGGEHSQLIGTLTNHANLKVRSLGYMLRECRFKRNQADYDIEQPFIREYATQQLEVVTRIFDKCRSLVQSGVLPKD